MSSEKGSETPSAKLESLMVEYLLAVRSGYLGTVNGRPSPGYWTTLQQRVRAAALQCDTASEWAATVQRGMQIPGLDSSKSRVLVDLVALCDEHGLHAELLEKAERDHALLVALAQRIVDERKRA